MRDNSGDHPGFTTDTLSRLSPAAFTVPTNRILSPLRAAFPRRTAQNLAVWPPAASVSSGINPATGTPIVVEIAAAPGSEGRFLAVAAQLEWLRLWQRVVVA